MKRKVSRELVAPQNVGKTVKRNKGFGGVECPAEEPHAGLGAPARHGEVSQLNTHWVSLVCKQFLLFLMQVSGAGVPFPAPNQRLGPSGGL